MYPGGTNDKAEVCTTPHLPYLQLTLDRPTHDLIERLQAKLDDLEGFLEKLCTLTGSEVSESLARWKNEGEADGITRATRLSESVPRPSDDRQEDEHGHDELLTFESPMGGDYIYDRDG